MSVLSLSMLPVGVDALHEYPASFKLMSSTGNGTFGIVDTVDNMPPIALSCVLSSYGDTLNILCFDIVANPYHLIPC
eukprot:8719182-Ditylum_brightwellii.AAC.1